MDDATELEQNAPKYIFIIDFLIELLKRILRTLIRNHQKKGFEGSDGLLIKVMIFFFRS